jgi:hypothetical protein
VPYPWPVRPFDRQHPVRGFLNDPRMTDTSAAFHFGVDVSAPDGTPVFAVAAGTAFFDDPTAIAVKGPAGPTFGYWHIDPIVGDRQYVAAGQVLGRIAAGWGHFHFAESRVRGRYLNPLRPGALHPFAKSTHPAVTGLEFRHGDRVLAQHAVWGLVDVIVEAHDTTPLPVPPPWNGMPVAPSTLRWRILQGARAVKPWHVGANLKPFRLQNAFHLIYAPATRPNHPGQPGRFRYYLAHDWASGSLPNGDYRLQVEAADLHGNQVRAAFPFRIANGGPQ